MEELDKYELLEKEFIHVYSHLEAQWDANEKLQNENDQLIKQIKRLQKANTLMYQRHFISA